MKKQIMVRAWEIAKAAVAQFGGKAREYFAEALRMAWAEAKQPAQKSTREIMIERLETIVSNSTAKNYCDFEVVANDWQKGGKNRTYLAIVEKSNNYKVSKHYAKKSYGYVDNVTGEYFADKYGDARENYTFGGAKF